jgi:hypothetical protein
MPNSAARDSPEPTKVDVVREAMSVGILLTPASKNTPACPSTPEHDRSIKSESSPTDTPMRDLTAAADDDDAEMEAIEEDDDNDDDIEREFTCVNDEYTRCRTGQYTKDLSRKVISDHFGRNKACTRDITDWPLFCRKHYQRATYNKALWQIRKLNLILRQFNIINRQFPGTTYDIVLKKSEESRLNEYSRKIAAGLAAADAAAAVAPRPAKHFEAPIDVLRELDQYLGRSKSVKDARDAVDVILQMLHEKETEQVPAIEFLPQLLTVTPSPKKASRTQTPKKASKTQTPKRASSVSARGSVKKTGQKA